MNDSLVIRTYHEKNNGNGFSITYKGYISQCPDINFGEIFTWAPRQDTKSIDMGYPMK